MRTLLISMLARHALPVAGVLAALLALYVGISATLITRA
jgi:hypothetical protein